MNRSTREWPEDGFQAHPGSQGVDLSIFWEVSTGVRMQDGS